MIYGAVTEKGSQTVRIGCYPNVREVIRRFLFKCFYELRLIDVRFNFAYETIGQKGVGCFAFRLC